MLKIIKEGAENSPCNTKKLELCCYHAKGKQIVCCFCGVVKEEVHGEYISE